jgi:putative FmdB family regulatory protein
MPLYEYQCAQCGHVFESLVRKAGEKPSACPQCGSKKLNKQFSTFSAGSSEGIDFPSCSSGTCSTGACPTGTCPFSGN